MNDDKDPLLDPHFMDPRDYTGMSDEVVAKIRSEDKKFDKIEDLGPTFLSNHFSHLRDAELDIFEFGEVELSRWDKFIMWYRKWFWRPFGEEYVAPPFVVPCDPIIPDGSKISIDKWSLRPYQVPIVRQLWKSRGDSPVMKMSEEYKPEYYKHFPEENHDNEDSRNTRDT